MENQGKESKIRTLIKEIPNWVQLLITLGTFIFALGGMYTTVKSLNRRVDRIEDTNVELIRMSGAVSNLQIQIDNSNNTQKQTNESVSKLTDAVNDLGNSVSNLQGKLDTIPNPPPKRHR